MKEKISLTAARSGLFKLWLIGMGFLFVLLMVQTFTGAFEITTATGEESQAKEVWGWFTPLAFPTLTLMIGIFGASSFQAENTAQVSKSFYQLTFYLSLFYILVLAFLIMGKPLLKYENPVKVLSLSNFFIGPLQGLVIAAIGYLFSSKQS